MNSRRSFFSRLTKSIVIALTAPVIVREALAKDVPDWKPKLTDAQKEVFVGRDCGDGTVRMTIYTSAEYRAAWQEIKLKDLRVFNEMISKPEKAFFG